jgi:hypothetical protein
MRAPPGRGARSTPPFSSLDAESNVSWSKLCGGGEEERDSTLREGEIYRRRREVFLQSGLSKL